MARAKQSEQRNTVRRLLAHYSTQNWWPAESRLEVVVGAYLTQNTAWTNVEKAITNLRRHKALSLDVLHAMPPEELEQMIRPAGYFRQKTRALKIFVEYVRGKYAGSLDRMFARPTVELRAELLALKGVGPETADSILLYAGGHPIFVVDAYTRRILHRHGLMKDALRVPYDTVRKTMEAAAQGLSLNGKRAADPRHPPSRMSRRQVGEIAQLYNELHAAMVRVGNEHCRRHPKCETCPLRSLLPERGPVPM